MILGKVIFHTNPDPERLALERAERFAKLPYEEKLKQLLALNDLAVKMNGGKAIKEPQGKGIIIRKPAKK